MTGGLMQLVAYGAQDIYLTGNPQITFFKIVYRRHTNFAIETIEHAFIQNPNFGKRSSVKITRNGDLVTKMYLRVTIDKIDPGKAKFAWIRRLGHAIIKEVEVTIGGSKIDKQYGTWLDIWYELARQGNHERGYAIMIGDIPELTTYNSEIKEPYTLYIPLQFWFNRYVGLAIPVIALQYSDVYIHVEFESAENIIVRDCQFDINKVKMKDATILVNYIYLDSEERRRFAQVGHEYLIEQLQFNGEELVRYNDSTFRLDFNFPVKEIFWVMRNGNYISGKTFVYYTNNDIWSVEEAARTILEKSISIGNDPSDIVGGNWTEIQANTIETVGTINVNNKSEMSVWINPESLKIGNYGITNKINADVIIESDGTIKYDNIVTNLTVRDLSIPVELMEDTRFNACDPIVKQFSNYGLLIDGSINPTATALLKFNGHDRFDRREGMYFNYVEPEIHHTNTPKDGINVYSFSLYPEEHQPSGTANFSRIDTSELNIQFSDPTLDGTVPDLHFINPDSRIWIFALNYNILRIYSGFGGVSYCC